MKIPKIIQLPSGAWHCQVRIDGKSISITEETKKEVEAKAFAYKAGIIKQKKTPEYITLSAAMDRYIKDRENILSPSTVREYKRIRKNEISILGDKLVCHITQAQLQRYINKISARLSPKTVRNNYCFIVSVIKDVIPDASFNCLLPQKKKYNPYAPKVEDIEALINAVKGTDLEVAVLLAAFGSLRRSEICALTVKDLRPQGVYVSRAVVLDDKRQLVTKATKTPSSTRFAPLPAEVVEYIKSRCSDKLYSGSPNTITKNFFNVLQRNNIPHFRFHDLRHYWVSISHALGLPDYYIMKNGGWTTMDTPRKIYMNDMSEVVSPQETAVLTHFSAQFKKANC